MEKSIKIEIPEGYDDAVFDKETNEIKFVKKDTKPRSWEEYCEQVQNTHCYAIDILSKAGRVIERNRGEAPFVNDVNSKKEAKAVIALCKLIQLRDVWCDKWKPNWGDDDLKYAICGYSNIIIESVNVHTHALLAFPTAALRDDFLKTFRDIIEEAKPLL